ncbi:adenosine deaminase [Actinoplanes couchii]|uniref:adenosine deaminase n=1 Tax=Actinoplanes couchii TaxID=403638 RepID=A0ABQ3XS93_9ACTN|nr:adenosine deaminase [Actinoplanes couchii]MDR6317976.1 adenosine deaminase [Actinoplanes couchii]GID61386.1 adenosine deaminase [Actinoplanes couchii]
MLIDLHRHLEGSLRVATTLELAHRDGHPLASAADPEDLLVARGPLGGLLPFLAKVDAAPSAFPRLEDWVRAARECVEDAAADGLDHLEIRFSPWFIRQETGLAPEAVIDAVADGARSAAEKAGLPVVLIGILLRDLGPSLGYAQADTLLSRRDLLGGIDIAGNEAGVPAAEFAGPFARARDAGLHVTVHAGEAAGPQSVWDAVRHLGAERIGHGVRAAEDPRLLEHLAEHRITLEVCLTSNVHTSAVTGYADHPVRRLLAAGVPVALCTDDPRTSGITLSGEYADAAARAGLTPADLDRIRADAQQAIFA